MKTQRINILFTIILLTATATLATAQKDPCPTKQQQFQGQAAATDRSWQQINTELAAAKFPKVAFLAAYREQLETRASNDLGDTITALNSTIPAKKKVSISKANLKLAVKTKVDLSLKHPDVRDQMERDTQAAEDLFLQKKAAAQLELANKKKTMDDQINDAHKKLNASCTYDFPSQMVRIASDGLQVQSKIEDGVLRIATFNTLQVKGGQLMYGDHPLMDIPVVTPSGISVGGANIQALPTFSSGNIEFPVVPGLPPVKVPLPPVTIGSGPGLGVTIGSWHF